MKILACKSGMHHCRAGTVVDLPAGVSRNGRSWIAAGRSLTVPALQLRHGVRLIALVVSLFWCQSVHAGLVVFAAASTTDAMKELSALYQQRTGEEVRFNFAASGALARQIDAGAPADIYLSANVKWMDYLQQAGQIDPATRSDLLANRLVLIEPRMNATGDEKDVFERIKSYTRLAVGDFASVPAGAYAEQALQYGGVLEELSGKLIKGDSVRRVLFYVERGEVDAGIVYATDAKVSSKVRVAGVFPAASHKPICYPVAVCDGARQKEEAVAFLAFLKSPDGAAVFKKYGFEMVQGK